MVITQQGKTTEWQDDGGTRTVVVGGAAQEPLGGRIRRAYAGLQWGEGVEGPREVLVPGMRPRRKEVLLSEAGAWRQADSEWQKVRSSVSDMLTLGPMEHLN